eukprot:CAMPEP_0168215656 /NCGR_PEP_ID=MMETSP0140_2-20121125/6109_1 /TAXON_ID=44445 /ORGANISM="Pseudo-nitzschia australis, Strain 10249 10 AB" /LENGTH=395 /DNA_ID=CAMNT_0008142917 /DNA_START=271 /DNA_END=1455 /DNA_ORIENTATION=-
MSEPEYKPNSKSVKDYIAKADLKPMVGNVTSLDVDNIQEIIAQALSKIKSRYTSEVAMHAGYSFLVESELGFQLRCRNETSKLPPPQSFPTKPRSETDTKMNKYYRDLDSYKIQHACDVAVCELVDNKFPGLLRDLKRPGIRSFDGVFTAREAFDHLDGEVGSTTAANDKFAVHLQSIIDRKYKPEQNGTKTYFASVEHDRYKANSTKVVTVLIEILLVYAQRAFRAAVDKHKVRAIENSWALVESANVSAFKDIEERYKQFKDHYITHLRNLVLDVDQKKHHPQAHVVASYGDTIPHMQGTMQSMVEEQNELREQYAHMVETNLNSRTGPPSVVATASTSSNTGTSSNIANIVTPTMSYNDVQEMIKKALQSVTPTGNNHLVSTPQQHHRPKKW